MLRTLWGIYALYWIENLVVELLEAFERIDGEAAADNRIGDHLELAFLQKTA